MLVESFAPVYLLQLRPSRRDPGSKRVCASCQGGVTCRRADRTVYTRRLGVTSEVAGGRDWLPSYQLIKPLARGHYASGHTLHLFHNTRTQSHTLARGTPQVWRAATCTSAHAFITVQPVSAESAWPR